MKTVGVIFLLCLGLAGCNAMTRDAFKEQVKSYSSFGLHQTYSVNRDMNAVRKSIESQWNSCLISARTTQRSSGGIPVSRTTDHTFFEVEEVSSSLVRMTIFQKTTGAIMIGSRKEGDFVVALDLERSGKGKTTLDWYSPKMGWSSVWDKTKAWSEGRSSSCN